MSVPSYGGDRSQDQDHTNGGVVADVGRRAELLTACGETYTGSVSQAARSPAGILPCVCCATSRGMNSPMLHPGVSYPHSMHRRANRRGSKCSTVRCPLTAHVETPKHRLDPRHHEHDRVYWLTRQLPVHRLHAHEAKCKREAVYRGPMAALRPTASRSSKGNLPDVSMAMASSAYCPCRSRSTISRMGRSMWVKKAL